MLFAVSIQWNIIGFLCVLLNWIIKAWYILCNEYVADMRKRQLNVDWKAVNGAAKRKRILHLTVDENEQYICPVSTCLHNGYKSSRGLRKHINSQHEWYFWFDERPRIQRSEAAQLPRKRIKSSTHKMAAFSMESGLGNDFLQWLMTPCGGGKVESEATQIGRRGMKFLAFSLGESTSDAVLEEDFLDCVLGSPSVIINFMQAVVEEWELASSGALNYLKAVSDLMDFRKANGVTDNVLRSFAATEVYIRRGIGNLARQKKIDYARNLDLESLISRNSWATLEEMESVVPHHTPKFEKIIKLIRENETYTVNDLAFVTRYIITFLFLRVKSSRPMTYKFLTLQQLHQAKENGGYVDQDTFKTANNYAFDTLILSKDVMTILDTYVKVIRPLLHPKCEYVILTTNGTQYSAFGTAMSIIVFEAIGKVINPTRYRQILESESAVRLSAAETEALSKDNKHSSQVAKRIYQKRLSRHVAEDGLNSVRKLVGSSREEHNNVLARSLTISDHELINPGSGAKEDPNGDQKESSDDEVQVLLATDDDKPPATDPPSTEVIEPEIGQEQASVESTLFDDTVSDGTLQLTEASLDDSLEMAAKERSISAVSSDSITTSQSSSTQQLSVGSITLPVVSLEAIPTPMIKDSRPLTPNIEVEVKKEEAQRQVDEIPRLLRFTSEEDACLKQGIVKYGLGNWSKILKDKEFKFHVGRTRDTLRVRADTLGMTKKKRKSTRNVSKSTSV